MPTYNVPGVYIEEIPLLPASVAPVATAVPAFIGYTMTGAPASSTACVPTRITSLLEYQQLYGGAFPEVFTVTVVGGAVTNASLGTASKFNLYNSVRMYFNNGGGPCYIVSVGTATGTPAAGDMTNGLNALQRYDEPTLVCIPESIHASSYATVANAMLSHCATMKDRFAIIDLDVDTIAGIGGWRTSISVVDPLKYGAAYFPRMRTSLEWNASGTSQVTIDGAAPVNLSTIQSPNPSLYRAILQAINDKVPHILPPSGAMAGIYASVDRDRGVWKAPANVGIASLIAPTVAISDSQQGDMNVTASGKSINAIRTFTGRGTLVWGARTLAGNDNEWRYISVRRFFNFVEESVQKAMSPVVFEPNTATTWARVKGTIEGFLTNLWRQGALAGSKPEQAFFVKIGLGVTMTPQDILEGRLIVDVGLAAVRPAEFVVMRFMHKMQES
jgi:uncharacterized protein